MNESADESDLECLRRPVPDEHVSCSRGKKYVTYQR